MNKLVTLLASLIFIAGTTSCHHKKKNKQTAAVVLPATPAAPAPVTAPSKNPSADLLQLLGPASQTQLDFRTLSSRVKMHLEGMGQDQSATVLLRMEKDKTIWMNVIYGGLLPVAKILVTPDSFKFINYIGREAVVLPISRVSDYFPVQADFQTIQRLLVGGSLIAGNPVSVADSGQFWELLSERGNFREALQLSKADSSLLKAATVNSAKPRQNVAIQMSDYTRLNGQRFSKHREVDLQDDQQRYHVEMDFTAAELNQPLEFNFYVPASFEVRH